MKNGFFWQLATIGFVARPELEASQHFLKFHKKKVRVIDWWSMAGLIHHSFLNPGDIITAEKYCHQIEILLRNTRKTATFISNIGQQKWFYPFPTTMPDHMWPDLQKLNETDYEILPHSPYSPDLSPTDYFFKYLDKFLREKCFKPQRDAETTFNDFVAFRTPKFYSTGITIITRCALIAMFIILINKILFELRYVHVKNILKITVNKNL